MECSMKEDIKINISPTFLNAVRAVDFSAISLPDFTTLEKNKVDKDTEDVVLDIELDGEIKSYRLGLNVSEPIPDDVSKIDLWFSKNIEDKDDLLNMVHEFDLNLYDIFKNIDFTEVHNG